jgi:hypothetical protein
MAFGSPDLQEVWVAHIKGLVLEAYFLHLYLEFKNCNFQYNYFEVYLSLEANNED